MVLSQIASQLNKLILRCASSFDRLVAHKDHTEIGMRYASVVARIDVWSGGIWSLNYFIIIDAVAEQANKHYKRLECKMRAMQ